MRLLHTVSQARLFIAGGLTVCVLGCASARPNDSGANPNGSDDAGRSSAGAAGNASAGNAGNRATAAGSGASSDCRGPGYYESGKEGSYRPCCAGLKEVPVGKTGYRGGSVAGEYEPSCEPPPLNVYACVTGECGDGICEEKGEAQACGCVADCPQAAFTWADTTRLGSLSGVPASCGKSDLLARLQTSAAAIDCGDLALDAAKEAREKAISCARDAIAASKPFQIFWREQGTDSLNHHGIVGRLENGALKTFAIDVDANVFSINFMGATASWWPCTTPSAATCDRDFETCLRCTELGESIVCGCLPKGTRPGAPPGSAVELRCEGRGE